MKLLKDKAVACMVAQHFCASLASGAIPVLAIRNGPPDLSQSNFGAFWNRIMSTMGFWSPKPRQLGMFWFQATLHGTGLNDDSHRKRLRRLRSQVDVCPTRRSITSMPCVFNKDLRMILFLSFFFIGKYG